MKYIYTLILFVILNSVALASDAIDALTVKQGVSILNFECQDNCYLTVMDQEKAVSHYLCHSDLCHYWAVEEKPLSEIVGLKADVIIGVGEQINSEGDVMGTMEAVHEILIQ